MKNRSDSVAAKGSLCASPGEPLGVGHLHDKLPRCWAITEPLSPIKRRSIALSLFLIAYFTGQTLFFWSVVVKLLLGITSGMSICWGTVLPVATFQRNPESFSATEAPPGGTTGDRVTQEKTCGPHSFSTCLHSPTFQLKWTIITTSPDLITSPIPGDLPVLL